MSEVFLGVTFTDDKDMWCSRLRHLPVRHLYEVFHMWDMSMIGLLLDKVKLFDVRHIRSVPRCDIYLRNQ